MLAWILQITIVSVILIFLVHHLIGFFKSTLTIPKIKDLVESPSQKYKNMFKQLNANDQTGEEANTNSFTKIDLLPKENNMKTELKSFLKKQLNVNQSDNASDIYSMDSTYSPYV
jgi:hypothetical protein